MKISNGVRKISTVSRQDLSLCSKSKNSRLYDLIIPGDPLPMTVSVTPACLNASVSTFFEMEYM